jgi:hypothetical protein
MVERIIANKGSAPQPLLYICPPRDHDRIISLSQNTHTHIYTHLLVEKTQTTMNSHEGFCFNNQL